MQTRGRSIIYIFLVLLLTAACQSDRSAFVLDDDDMEDLLYDIHRAHFTFKDGEDSRSDGAYQYALFLKVLEKHKVTQAEWDSTLVYYTCHANELQKIYTRLGERLEIEAQSIGAAVGEVGDSTNIWHDESNMILTAYQPYTTRQWSIRPDSLLKAGENLTLKFTGLYLQPSEVQRAECIFAMVLSNDSVVVTNQMISRTGLYTLRLSDSGELGIKELKGMFMMYQKNPNSFGVTTTDKFSTQILCVKDIKLLHELPEDKKSDASDSSEDKGDMPMKDRTTSDSAVNVIHEEIPVSDQMVKSKPLKLQNKMINN